MSRVSILIPAFNEEAGIAAVLDDVRREMDASGVEYEVIVIDDGSTDKTGQLARSKGAIVIAHDTNAGYGAAIKSGIERARFEWLVIMDADGSYAAKDLISILPADGSFAMIVGARTGVHVEIPLMRRPAKWFLGKLAEYLSGHRIPDLNSGLRVFQADLMRRFFSLLPDGFSLTTTLTVAALTNGYRVNFVPINYYARKGRSSIRPIRDFVNFLALIVRLTVYFRPLNVFLPVSIGLVSLGILKAIIDFVRLNHIGVGAALVILTGLQIAFLGLLADLILQRTRL